MRKRTENSPPQDRSHAQNRDEAAGPALLAYTVDSLESASGISRSAIYQDIANGKLQVRKWGSRTVIPAADAQAWIEAMPRGTPRPGNEAAGEARGGHDVARPDDVTRLNPPGPAARRAGRAARGESLP
jgi:hypothetical protein